MVHDIYNLRQSRKKSWSHFWGKFLGRCGNAQIHLLHMIDLVHDTHDTHDTYSKMYAAKHVQKKKERQRDRLPFCFFAQIRCHVALFVAQIRASAPPAPAPAPALRSSSPPGTMTNPISQISCFDRPPPRPRHTSRFLSRLSAGPPPGGRFASTARCPPDPVVLLTGPVPCNLQYFRCLRDPNVAVYGVAGTDLAFLRNPGIL